jgi:hypothetical protein
MHTTWPHGRPRRGAISEAEFNSLHAARFPTAPLNPPPAKVPPTRDGGTERLITDLLNVALIVAGFACHLGMEFLRWVAKAFTPYPTDGSER